MQGRAVGKWQLVGPWMGRRTVRWGVEWKSVGLRMGQEPAEQWMQFAVRSGQASRPTAVGSTPFAADNTLIDSGSRLIGLRGSLAKFEDFGRGRKQEQQQTIQPMGICVSGSKSHHDHGNYTLTNTSTPSISFATLSNRASSCVFASFP